MEKIEVRWVGHAEVKHFRKQNKLPDKNDQADAAALALYAFTHWHNEEFFLHFNAGNVARLRELWLQLQSINRIQSAPINRIRQQLAKEFPEAALSESKPGDDGIVPLWAWLAGRERNTQRKSSYYDRLYAKSIAPKYGVGISDFTRTLASLICDLRDWENKIVAEILQLLNAPEFMAYRKVMTQFGIGDRQQALFISQIFPITKFESLGRFKRRLGMAKDEESSGDKEAYKTGGSKFCRSQLYLWVLNRIAPQRARPQNDIGQKLGDFYDQRKSQFQDNPELWKQKALSRTQKKAMDELRRSLTESLLPMLPKDQQPQIEAILNLTLQNMQLSLDQSLAGKASSVKEGEIKRGFGNLIISQTAAYGLRLMFKELKRAID
jgi:Transposase IS116/IS110/IS902 family